MFSLENFDFFQVPLGIAYLLSKNQLCICRAYKSGKMPPWNNQNYQMIEHLDFGFNETLLFNSSDNIFKGKFHFKDIARIIFKLKENTFFFSAIQVVPGAASGQPKNGRSQESEI